MTRALTTLFVIACTGWGVLDAYTLLGPTWPGTSATYWVNPVNNDGLSHAAVVAAVQQSADSWSSSNPELETSFDVVYAGQTSRSTVDYNGTNDVFFRNESNGAIATAYTWWIGSTVVESDIVMWDTKTFFTGETGCQDGYYVEDIMTHEMGHFVGVGHTNVAGATMRASTSKCNKGLRSLAADDIAAVEALYGDPGAVSPPPTPTGLTTQVDLSAPTVQLQWSDVPDDSGYLVERSLDNVNFVNWGQTGPSVTTFVDSSVSYETSYWYRVRSTNSGGESSPTAGVLAAVGGDPSPAPGAVTLRAELKLKKGIYYVWVIWDGATGETVDVTWNQSAVTTKNDGFFKYVPEPGRQSIQVCEAGGSPCSPVVEVDVPGGGGDPSPPSSITLEPQHRRKSGIDYIWVIWSGATGETVDVSWNQSSVTTKNDGFFKYVASPGPQSIQVCEAGSSTCSPVVVLGVP